MPSRVQSTLSRMAAWTRRRTTHTGRSVACATSSAKVGPTLIVTLSKAFKGRELTYSECAAVLSIASPSLGAFSCPACSDRTVSASYNAGRTVVSIDGYEDVPVNSEAALTRAVSSQPISVAICASEAMQFYSSGVIAGAGSCTGLNHGVLAVGYDKVGLVEPYHIDEELLCPCSGTLKDSTASLH